MEDMQRIKDDFVFEEQPYGTVGTGDQNYVGSQLSTLTDKGLLLGCQPNTELTKSDDAKPSAEKPVRKRRSRKPATDKADNKDLSPADKEAAPQAKSEATEAPKKIEAVTPPVEVKPAEKAPEKASE